MGLVYNSTLRVLDLCILPVKDSHVVAENRGIGTDGIKALGWALMQNAGLEELNLGITANREKYFNAR